MINHVAFASRNVAICFNVTIRTVEVVVNFGVSYHISTPCFTKFDSEITGFHPKRERKSEL